LNYDSPLNKAGGDTAKPNHPANAVTTGTLPDSLASSTGAARKLRSLAARATDSLTAEIAGEAADWIEAILDRVLLLEAQVLHLKDDLSALLPGGAE
jgi:hypothetical protein